MCTQQRQDQDWTDLLLNSTSILPLKKGKHQCFSISSVRHKEKEHYQIHFNSFYESSITLTSKLGTPYTEKEKQSVDQTLSLRYKNSQ